MGGVHLRRFRARGSTRAVIAASALAAALTTPTLANAQPHAAPLVPIVTPLRSDDLFASARGPRLDAAFTPLRLSLTSGLFAQGNSFPGCDSRTDASGNAVSGFALQRYTFLRLAPPLVLHGFSNAGCAIDAGMGGGLTYAIPLRKSWWLVPSAGFYALPTPGSPTASRYTGAGRVDVVKQLAWGRTLSFGLGARVGSGNGTFNALNFGGSF